MLPQPAFWLGNVPRFNQKKQDSEPLHPGPAARDL